MTDPSSPLQIRDFRFFLLARLLTVCATLSMVVLVAYQAYDIARADYGMSRANAAFQLGLLGLAQFVPLFVLTPVAGFAADRFDRRYVAAFANGIDCTIGLALAILTLADALTLPILFALAAAHGAARVFTGPALSAIAPNIVPVSLLPKAIAFSSMAWQGGTVVGPAIGGFLFAIDHSVPYFVSAAMLIVSANLILSVRPVKAAQIDPDVNPFRRILEGFTFIRHHRFLLGCITLDLFAVLLGGATAMLPVFARDILHVGPEGLGLMRGAPALGAGAVALWFSFRPLESNVGVKMLVAVAVFGAATVGFGYSQVFLLSLALLFVLGAADMVSVFIRSTLMQLHTPDDMRGRVSATSGLAISASNELGEMRAGLSATLLGVTGTVVFGGFAAIFVTALWAWIFPELRRAKTFAPQYNR